jgi:hypothetical protein
MGAVGVPSEETALRRAGPLVMNSDFAPFSIAGDSEFQIRRHVAHASCFKEHNIRKKYKVKNRGALQFDLVAASCSDVAPLLVDFIDRRLKKSPKGVGMNFWQIRQKEAITG